MDQDKYKELLTKLENMDETLEKLRAKLDGLPEEEVIELSPEEKRLKKILDASFW